MKENRGSSAQQDGKADARETDDDPDAIDRREFVRSAMLVGGAGAVSALGGIAGCSARRRDPGSDDATAGGKQTVDSPTAQNRISAARRDNRQHAWDEFEPVAGTGNTAPPASSVFLMLDYQGDGTPTGDERRQVEEAFREVERNFEWSKKNGVLFTMAYSSSYFDRFDEDPPAGADPMPAEEVADLASQVTPYDPEPDEYDANLVVAGNNPANVLAVEAALWGEDEDIDVSFDATLEGVFNKPTSWPERRVGFADTQLPRDRYKEEFDADIPEESPLSMGFIAGFGSSIPSEDEVTLVEGQQFPTPDVDESDVPTDLPYVGEVGERDPGVFAQGTLKQLSYLEIDLSAEDSGWYSLDQDRRRLQMYSPYHTQAETEHPGDVEKPGAGLADDGEDPGAQAKAVDDDVPDLPTRRQDGEDYASRTHETAAEGGGLADEPTVGHSQKAARSRIDLDGDGKLEQPVLRRDWDGIRPASDEYDAKAGYHFNVPMRFNEYIFTLLHANYSIEFTSLDGAIDHEGVDGPASGDGPRNGLAHFLEATRRTNFLVPPIELRALPHPQSVKATIEDVQTGDDVVRVTVTSDADIDPETVRFGPPTAVNKAGGASPNAVSTDGNTSTFEFDPGAAAVANATRVRLFAKTAEERRPVLATTTL